MANERLASASSPYLRMHAGDPVDWYAWGEEVFARARETDRPIFLSVGYAACHWCHVMQRQSFRDKKTAAFLNEHFVAVKVDRELRPDVDALYMDYVVATAGHGGWPMSVFLTPQLAPMMGGTFYPAEPMEGVPSFMQALETIEEIWRDERNHAEVIAQAAIAFLREQSAPRAAGEILTKHVDDAAESGMRLLDEENGGFGDAPKFPQWPFLSFLIAYARRTSDPIVANLVSTTMRGMLRGGVYDQAGGGIARYSVDDAWTVPHFEKMLYDNALLLSCLASAHRLSPSEEYAHAAKQTAAFLSREMAAPGGGFFASLSAETDGEEGATYVWPHDELVDLLAPEEMELAEAALGVTREGNFEGLNVLTRRGGRDENAEAVDRLLEKVLAARTKRPQPDADDKVLMSWNALAAGGLIEAGSVFGDEESAALGLATLRRLADAVDGDDVPRDVGDPAGSARLVQDYAALTAACLTAVEEAGEERWLDLARSLHAAAIERFEDYSLLFMTPAEVDLPVRPREQGDEPAPSGAATMCLNALRLHAITGEADFLEWAGHALPQFWALIDFAPEHAGTVLEAVMGYFDASAESPTDG